MQFSECVDYGDAKTIMASGVASITLISPDIVQVTLYQLIEMPDGTLEKRVAVRCMWGRKEWLAAGKAAIEARANIERRADDMVVSIPRLVVTAH